MCNSDNILHCTDDVFQQRVVTWRRKTRKVQSAKHMVRMGFARCESVQGSEGIAPFILVIIIITISHQLGLDRPVSASQGFQVVFVHLVYKSALFSVSCRKG